LCPSEWRIAAETSLAVPQENLLPVLSAVDEFIVDCKDMNPDIYRRYTGGDAQLMKDNLEFLLESCGADRIIVRVPRIPGFNTDADQRKSVEFLREMGVTRLDLFDYVIRDE
jgi:Pyruvate-formate lyase-activating enzyme